MHTCVTATNLLHKPQAREHATNYTLILKCCILSFLLPLASNTLWHPYAADLCSLVVVPCHVLFPTGIRQGRRPSRSVFWGGGSVVLYNTVHSGFFGRRRC